MAVSSAPVLDRVLGQRAAELVEIAEAKLSRMLIGDECREFLHASRCETS